MFEILNDKDIKEAKVGHVAILVNGKPQVFDGDRAVAQAQLMDALRQVVEWGEEDCPHKTFRWKQNCWACWRELKQQAEEKG